MASTHDMVSYAAYLNVNTPTNAKGRPVTEICLFKLKREYAEDHAAAAAIFEAAVVPNCTPGVAHAKGIRRIGWGFSTDDPVAFAWMLDWDKIEDHWGFWKDIGFPPVIACIEKLFEPGRPLVRHYDFGGRGFASEEGREYVQITVWDDGADGKHEGRARGKRVGGGKHLAEVREGYAVDLGEDTWWCTMLGYESESDAQNGDQVNGEEDAVSHMYRVKYQG